MSVGRNQSLNETEEHDLLDDIVYDPITDDVDIDEDELLGPPDDPKAFDSTDSSQDDPTDPSTEELRDSTIDTTTCEEEGGSESEEQRGTIRNGSDPLNRSSAEELDYDEEGLEDGPSQIILGSDSNLEASSSGLSPKANSTQQNSERDEEEEDDDEDESRSRSGRSKFQSERTPSLKIGGGTPKKIPDNLDQVRVDYGSPKAMRGNQGRRGGRGNFGGNRPRGGRGGGNKVLLNPHYAGRVQADPNIRLLWESAQQPVMQMGVLKVKLPRPIVPGGNQRMRYLPPVNLASGPPPFMNNSGRNGPPPPRPPLPPPFPRFPSQGNGSGPGPQIRPGPPTPLMQGLGGPRAPVIPTVNLNRPIGNSSGQPRPSSSLQGGNSGPYPPSNSGSAGFSADSDTWLRLTEDFLNRKKPERRESSGSRSPSPPPSPRHRSSSSRTQEGLRTSSSIAREREMRERRRQRFGGARSPPRQRSSSHDRSRERNERSRPVRGSSRDNNRSRSRHRSQSPPPPRTHQAPSSRQERTGTHQHHNQPSQQTQPSQPRIVQSRSMDQDDDDAAHQVKRPMHREVLSPRKRSSDSNGACGDAKELGLGSDYLKKIAAQKRLREEMLRKKEQRRLQRKASVSQDGLQKA